MKDIDFLPAKYREATAHRKTQVWRVVVLIVFAGLLLAAAGGQYGLRLGFERKRSMRALNAALVAVTLSGCYSYVVAPMPMGAMPVLVAPESPRLSINPKSYKFRIAVLDFIDQTNSAGDLVRTIPDILTTSMFDTQRYDIYDRGQLRDKSVSEVERLVTHVGIINRI